MTPPPSPLFLTIPEAAARLRVSRDTVYKLLRAGELHGRKLGRVWRIPTRVVDELADTGPETAA